MDARDDIGSRGEHIFCARIMDFCGRRLPYFRPRFLGEKARALDFLVELVGNGDRTMFFFVQVKTTRRGYTTRGGRRLKVSVPAEAVRQLAGVVAPTYLVGIDEEQEVGYLLAILTGMKGAIPSLPTDFPLDRANLPRLYQEVEQFWTARDTTRQHSAFSD